MRKRAVSSQRETTSGSERPGGKSPKRSGPDEEAQKSPAMITVNSPEKAPDALPTLEGATQDAFKEACASLENEAPVERPPNIDKDVREALTAETTIGPLLQARRFSLTIPGTRRARLHDRLMLGSYVKMMEWGRPSMDVLSPSPDEAQLIIDH